MKYIKLEKHPPYNLKTYIDKVYDNFRDVQLFSKIIRISLNSKTLNDIYVCYSFFFHMVA